MKVNFAVNTQNCLLLCKWIQLDYQRELWADDACIAYGEKNEAEFRLVQHGDMKIMVCRGSDHTLDWVQNFRFLGRRNREHDEHVVGGARRWHRGFLAGACDIYDVWHSMELPVPDLVVGHSAGAARAAILAWTWRRQCVAFACPRYSYGMVSPIDWANITHINRRDDMVRLVPLFGGYLGPVRRLKVPWKFGQSHTIDNYIDALEAGGLSNG